MLFLNNDIDKYANTWYTIINEKARTAYGLQWREPYMSELLLFWWEHVKRVAAAHGKHDVPFG